MPSISYLGPLLPGCPPWKGVTRATPPFRKETKEPVTRQVSHLTLTTFSAPRYMLSAHPRSTYGGQAASPADHFTGEETKRQSHVAHSGS